MNTAYIDVPAKGYFFQDLTKDSINQQEPFDNVNFGDSYPIGLFTIFRNLTSQYYSFISSSDLNDLQLKYKTLQLIEFIITKYPYYEEHPLWFKFER